MTTTPDAPDLRQAAIAAAVTAFTEAPVGPIISDTDGLESAIEDAVAAAFATLAGNLYIAPDPTLPPDMADAVWVDGEEKHLAHELHVAAPVWALLAAVIPPGHDHAQDQEDGS